jgi:hypothetical protein
VRMSEGYKRNGRMSEGYKRNGENVGGLKSASSSRMQTRK